MRSRPGAKRQQIVFVQNPRRLFRRVEQLRNQSVFGRDLMPLQPEEYIGLAAHRANLDDLLQTEQVRRNAAVNNIRQLYISLVERLYDGCRVDARSGRSEERRVGKECRSR